jgi:hypothetical protein
MIGKNEKAATTMPMTKENSRAPFRGGTAGMRATVVDRETR